MKKFQDLFVKVVAAWCIIAVTMQIGFVILDLTGNEKKAKNLSSFFIKKLDGRYN